MKIWNTVRPSLERWLRTPIFSNGISFIVGTVFGLVVLGWTLWPVQYINNTPDVLRADLQADYLRMAVDSYAVNGDATLARSRFELLGDRKLELLEALHNDPLMDPGRLSQFEILIATAYVSGTPAPEATAAPAEADAGLQGVLSLVAIIGIVIGGAIAVVVAVNIRRQRGAAVPPRGVSPVPAELSLEAEEDLEQRSPPAADAEEETSGEGIEPLERFVTTYALGDDLYEDSFTINSPDGDFLGECGVGISEPIGVGEPKKVTAMEVWLFDRKPSRTSTTVLMSEYADPGSPRDARAGGSGRRFLDGDSRPAAAGGDPRADLRRRSAAPEFLLRTADPAAGSVGGGEIIFLL
jgi:hypothetical protein